MTMTSLAKPTSAPSCSEWALSQQLDPAGTAGNYKGFLLVEQPLPWPADASSVPELAGVSELASSAGLRLQLLSSESRPGRSDDGGRRVICYRQAQEGWAGDLVRSECIAPAGQVAAAVSDMVSSGAAGAPSPGAASSQDGGAVVDVLVCTHGQRDTCCGSKGTRLFAELTESPLGAAQLPVRLWRTSHTGGHRFAPSAIAFPSGTMWAYSDSALLRAVVGAGAGEAGTAPGHYRGCATLGTPRAQALERAVFAKVGWSVLRDARRALEAPGGRLRLETLGNGTWEGAVREGRRVPQPDCRTDPGAATKHGVEWVVEDLCRLG